MRDNDRQINTIPPSPIRPGILKRPRIDALLAKGIEYPVVTLTAGAGYGKTQAATMFLNSVIARTAWLQLSKMDNYEESFWKKFLDEIPFYKQDDAELLRQLGFPNTDSKFKQFIYLFAKEIYKGNQFIFVLDDFHLISNEIIIGFIQNLIYTRLENFCIILISRTEINLDFSGIFTGGMAARITAEDLRFTSAETGEFLELQDLELNSRDLERIHVLTEGWPLALYLVSLSVKKDGVVAGNPIAGAIPLIFEMIEREIFSLYTSEIQNSLIKISILDTFPAGLIKELSGDNFERMLKAIDTNMFIRYDLHAERYNFHQLFLDFLTKKQMRLSENEITRVYLKAADWFARHNQKMDALTYYKKCERYEKVWDTVFHLRPSRRPKKITGFLISFLDELPKEFAANHPLIRVMRASFLLNNLELASAETDLLALAEEMEALPQTQENMAVAGEAYIILTLIYLTLRDYRFINYSKMANEHLPEGSSFDYTNIKIIDSNDSIIPHSPAKKDIDEMLSALFEALPYISKVTHGLAAGADYLAAAEVAYFSNDFRKADEQVFQAVYKAKQEKQTDIVCCAYFLLMRLMAARGDYKAAEEHLTQLKEYAEKSSEDSFFSIIDIAEGWFYIRAGMPHEIAGWIINDSLNDEIHSPISVGRDRLIRAYCLLENGKYDELLAFLDQLEELYYQKGLFFEFIFINVFKTIAHYENGRQQQWLDALQYAYEISRESGYIMQFVEMGSHMRKIIDSARKLEGKHNIPLDWLNSIYVKASTYAKRQAYFRTGFRKRYNNANSINNPGLTNREEEVLKCLCQGLKRDEIAQSLYISSGTVKNVLNSIYSKLGALNNADAVRIATQMRIV